MGIERVHHGSVRILSINVPFFGTPCTQASPNTTELVSMEGGGTKELLPLEPPRLDHCSIQVEKRLYLEDE